MEKTITLPLKDVLDPITAAEAALVQDYNSGIDTRQYIIDALKSIRTLKAKLERP